MSSIALNHATGLLPWIINQAGRPTILDRSEESHQGPVPIGGATRRTASSRVEQAPCTNAFLSKETELESRTDEQLVDAYLDGDREAFTELLERYRNELFHFLIRFLGSRAAADDVFQETFLQIHLSADTFDTSRRFKPWLFTIAANKARDYHRRQKRRSALSLSAPVGGADGEETDFIDLLESDEVQPAEPLLENEQQQLVKQVVDEMPQQYREILLLSYFQKMSYSQIAECLQIPLGTVKSRLHSAVAHFADSWKTARHDFKRTA